MICIFAAAAVPSMLVACVLGAPPPIGVALAIGGFASTATYFAFGKAPPAEKDVPE